MITGLLVSSSLAVAVTAAVGAVVAAVVTAWVAVRNTERNLRHDADEREKDRRQEKQSQEQDRETQRRARDQDRRLDNIRWAAEMLGSGDDRLVLAGGMVLQGFNGSSLSADEALIVDALLLNAADPNQATYTGDTVFSVYRDDPLPAEGGPNHVNPQPSVVHE